MIEFNEYLEILILFKNPLNELHDIRKVLKSKLNKLFLINDTPVSLVEKSDIVTHKYKARISNMKYKFNNGIKFKQNIDNLISVEGDNEDLKDLKE